MKKNTNKKNIRAHAAGFTLVEVLVAIAIFTVAITGVITITVSGGISINSAKNNLTANYLAQEGIELMRAKRDSYVISGSTYLQGWQDFTTDVASECSGPCDLDVASLDNLVPSSGRGFYSCAVFTDCNLSYTSDGFYVHGSGTSTIFNRELTIVSFTNSGTVPTELQVTSTVTWKEGYTTKSVSLNESLFDWYTPPPS